ncbi:hypothetical protein Q8A67_018703 [Cirrhinus molitorella]|uniref:Uncharacterized protein n=1 Tax=Cirrhinus molitorella TaxID=172907 RepID=A0AA88PCN3_9TELE|nr:hypothetical protein Q8A67_018703 [Cirrhinus molitorella]
MGQDEPVIEMRIPIRLRGERKGVPGRKKAGGREKQGRALKKRCLQAQRSESHILAVGTFHLVERSFGVGGTQAQSALTLTVSGVQRVLHE